MSGRNILITGAGGFVGSRLVGRLLADEAFAEDRFLVADLDLAACPVDPRVQRFEGDLASPEMIARLSAEPVAIAYLIAGILGGAAERDYALSRRFNIDATLSLLEALRNPDAPPRVVFTSSIAVFGPPLPDSIDDDTVPYPTMIYGAQKRVLETMIEHFSARGWIDGLAPRLPGIVARPGADERLKSAFLNAMFFAWRDGKDIVLPVPPDGTTWLLSVPACIDALTHAAEVPAGRLGQRRAFTLPAQCLSMRQLCEGLAARFPDSATRVTFSPDPEITAQFAAQQPLDTAFADALGFHHDGSIAALVARALGDAGS